MYTSYLFSRTIIKNWVVLLLGKSTSVDYGLVQFLTGFTEIVRARLFDETCTKQRDFYESWEWLQVQTNEL